MRNLAVSAILFFFSALSLSAQIVAPGAKPAGINGGLRSVLSMPRADMGRFDRDSALLAIDRNNRGFGMLRGFVFAKKETRHTDIIKEGQHFNSEDRDVWQYRITSKGAESLSFFFSDFFLPDGAFLSVYSATNPQVIIGPFGADNNSLLRSLSTVPINADDVIIEVSSPRGTAPRMTLEEVNTGLLKLFEAYEDGAYACSPDAACMPHVSDIARSVVMIITDGTAIGTGTLVNNASEDGTPYILTASHVMNWNFGHKDYDRRASKTVAVFNYHSPLCGDGIQPSTAQALSGATMVGVDETTDLALIKMETPPPASYRAYYAGWNATERAEAPFLNLHHPKAQPTKYNQFDGNLSYASFPESRLPFGAGLFHKVSRWDVGTTASVSSGSPLLDSRKLIIGTLTGGDSYCGPVGSDYFSSLSKLWARISTSDGAGKIANALMAGKTGTLTLQGREASGSRLPDATRVGHITLPSSENKQILSLLKQVPHETLTAFSEVAERYDLASGTKLYGVYLLFETKATASATTASEPMTLTLYNAESGAKITDVPVPTEQLTTPSKKDRLREIYVPLTEPLVASAVTPILFALNTSGFPSGSTIASQTGGAATAFGKSGNAFQAIAPASTLWIDLLLSDKKLADVPQPFVQITSTGEGHLALTFAPEYASVSGQLLIHTVLGQPVAKFTITNGYLLIPNDAVTGLGVLLFRISLGDRSETLKLLVQK